MPAKWTPEMEREMLLRVVTDGDLKPTAKTWEAVAQNMGQGVNANAVSQKFYKLKREHQALIDGKASASSENGISKTVKTPNQGKTSTPASKSTGTGAKKRKGTELKEEDQDSDSPSKKPKVGGNDNIKSEE